MQKSEGIAGEGVHNHEQIHSVYSLETADMERILAEEFAWE